MSTYLRDLVLEQIVPLTPVLNEVMGKAVTIAEHAVTQTAEIGPEYRVIRVHLARAKALDLLKARDDLGTWAVDETQAKKTALRLYCDDVVLRFLHSPTGTPAPGRNHARRAWYANTPLFETPQLFASPERFLLIWTADFATGGVSMRVVHPTSPWNFGEKAHIDLSVSLDCEDDFTSDSFDTHDGEEELDISTLGEAAEGDDGHSIFA